MSGKCSPRGTVSPAESAPAAEESASPEAAGGDEAAALQQNEPTDDRLIRGYRHDAVCAVDSVLHQETRPGVAWNALLQRAVETYAAHGFPEEWKRHHQGGPMGYACPDLVATPGDGRLVVENQLVGWNPSITGTKSEDTILSTGEVLTAMEDWPMRQGRPDILVRGA